MLRSQKRKAFGQHFLNDQIIIDSIVSEFLKVYSSFNCESILEIGPGKGALTFCLLDQLKTKKIEPKKLTLAEKDRELVQHWKQQEQDISLDILEGDFLRSSTDKWYKEFPIGVISNLPYSSATAIVTKLASFNNIPCMVLMFQKEVAQRLHARPNTKALGSLSLWIQNNWDVKPLIIVKPQSFTPPPKVDSEVVIMTKRSAPVINKTNENNKTWEKLLKICFQNRRKMLRSNLKLSQWSDVLKLSEVDPTRRAEALSWDEWKQLFSASLKVFNNE